MCTIWTARIGYGGHGLDITVKSASESGAILAPTWDMVMGHKRGRLTDAQYTERYLALLRDRYRQDERQFVALLEHKSITLMCYCEPKTFCHRYIAVDVLEKIAFAKGIEFKRAGEIYNMCVR